jgi:uncharacterized protein (UPF0276 family)
MWWGGSSRCRTTWAAASCWRTSPATSASGTPPCPNGSSWPRSPGAILLDVNNVFVSAHNHRFDPAAYLAGLPAERVGQIHLAGHSRRGRLLIDTHDHPVPDPVWALYRQAITLLGPRSTLIEWDDKLPALDRLLEQSARARTVETEALAPPLAAPRRRRA